MAKYMSCADTAKLIRQALKESFPGIKFGVTSKTYSGGASINVRWSDGPNKAQVEAVAGVFSGAYFDGSIDLKGSTFAMIDGVQVRFGADFIFCNRDESLALIQKACDSASRYWGLPPMAAEDFKAGRLYSVSAGNSGRSAQELVWQKLSKMSDRLSVAKSKTAGKVIYLGNDGYSQSGALQAVAA